MLILHADGTWETQCDLEARGEHWRFSIFTNDRDRKQNWVSGIDGLDRTRIFETREQAVDAVKDYVRTKTSTPA